MWLFVDEKEVNKRGDGRGGGPAVFGGCLRIKDSIRGGVCRSQCIGQPTSGWVLSSFPSQRAIVRPGCQGVPTSANSQRSRP